VEYVLEGLRNGFKLDFLPTQSLKSAKRNKPSAYLHPSVIDDYLANEVSLGRVAGPFRVPPFLNFHVSSFGVIPKNGQPGKWRLIVDLSSPGGASVNDGINPDEFTLHCITVDQVIRLVSRFGKGALMTKFDVEAAYRNIAVHSSDRYLLGMQWRDHYFVDLALPFGLRSAPYIFNSVADLVEWILVNSYGIPDLLHYLDDFITAGPPDSPQCAHNLNTALAVCGRRGLPLHPDKCVGPASFWLFPGTSPVADVEVASDAAGSLGFGAYLKGQWFAGPWTPSQQPQSIAYKELFPVVDRHI